MQIEDAMLKSMPQLSLYGGNEVAYSNSRCNQRSWVVTSCPSLSRRGQVGGMIRALEHFTRVLFTGGDSDLCAQFLYANLTSNSLGTTQFPARLSEEELNRLLCGEKTSCLIICVVADDVL